MTLRCIIKRKVILLLLGNEHKKEKIDKTRNMPNRGYRDFYFLLLLISQNIRKFGVRIIAGLARKFNREKATGFAGATLGRLYYKMAGSAVSHN
jgi:hypothetical protein